MNTNIDYSEYAFGLQDSRPDKVEEVLADIDGDTHSYIFMNLNSWRELTRDQYKLIINKVLQKVNKQSGLHIVGQWYYEDKDKNGNPTRLHVHGMISNVPQTFYPYGGLLKYISKQFHKEIGKPRVQHKICANISWAHSNEAVATYCSKQHGLVNYYVPE